MRGWFRSLMSDERPAAERVLILAIGILSGFVIGVLLSPLSTKTVGSYNGNCNSCGDDEEGEEDT